MPKHLTLDENWRAGSPGITRTPAPPTRESDLDRLVTLMRALADDGVTHPAAVEAYGIVLSLRDDRDVRRARKVSDRDLGEPRCRCGSETPTSARYGHAHLVWCAKATQTAVRLTEL